MKRTAIRNLAAIGLALLGGSVASSCSLPTRSHAEHQPVRASATTATAAPIAQVDFGRRARFAPCVSRACPAVTPKTLSVERDPAETTTRPVDIGRSLRTGEALVSTPDRAQPMSVVLAPPRSAQIEPDSAPATRQVTVQFPFASAMLGPPARALIDEAAAQPDTQRVVIRGRTDNVGPAAANDALARARAQAVQQHLRTRHPHLAMAQLPLDAQGTCCFTAPNDTPDGRARNRRVEIVFGRDTGAP